MGPSDRERPPAGDETPRAFSREMGEKNPEYSPPRPLNHPTAEWSPRTIAAALAERSEDVAIALLGRGNRRDGRAMRWGRRGSLVVQIAGPNRGLFFDHESGRGGGLL